jgi:hypothetical protein
VSISPATDNGAPAPAPPKSIADAVGGPLGVAETAVPAAAFVIVLTATGQNIRTAAIVAVGLAALLAAARIVRRQTPIYAVSGVIGVAIAGYIASKTGKAENFFLPGLLMNAGYATAYVVSIVAGWPLVGVIVAALMRGDSTWRRDRVLVRAYNRATWIWAGLFLARIAVQLPLYLAGALVVLGAARVGMGVPLFVIGVWLSWLVLRQVPGGAPWLRPEPAPPGPS